MSFRFRVTIVMLLMAVLLFSVGGTVLIGASFRTALRREEELAENEMRRILAQTAREWKTLESGDTGVQLAELAEEVFRNTLFDGVCFCEVSAAGDGGDTVLFAEGMPEDWTETGTLREDGITIRMAGTSAGSPHLWISACLAEKDARYSLIFAKDISGLYADRDVQMRIFRIVYCAYILLAASFSFLAATVMTRSLRSLSKAAREIASGNLRYRSDIRSDDEIGALSRDFDRMAQQVDENMTALREEAEKRERFMSAFTHELKTPMTSIIGYADLLRSQKVTPEEAEDALSYIYSEGKRLETLSLRLLDLFVAGSVTIERRPVVPAVLIRDITAHLMPQLAKTGCVLVTDTQDGSANLEPDLIRTLLINLIDNARKAMPEGGTITVRQKMEEKCVILTVRDEGCGMTEETLAHITEPFFRADKARSRREGSAGLGLALCKTITDLHNGTLEFESKRGEGTLVRVTLPVNDTREDAP